MTEIIMQWLAGGKRQVNMRLRIILTLIVVWMFILSVVVIWS